MRVVLTARGGRFTGFSTCTRGQPYGTAVAEREAMLLREAVSPAPDAVAARRVAIAMATFTALVLGGAAYAAARARRTPIAQTPTIVMTPRDAGPATEDVARATSELNHYRHLFYSQWVMASPGRSCPARLLEINRFDARLHAVDPWGTPYQFLCGARYRPTFQVRSAGFDRVFDTEDDVTP